MQLRDMIQALIDAGMSQAEIAKEAGTSQPTIYRALNGADMRYSAGRTIERLYQSRFVNTDNVA